MKISIFFIFFLFVTACLYYRSNCTESVWFDSIQIQEYVYTSGVEANQFDRGSIRGTKFTELSTKKGFKSETSSFYEWDSRFYEWDMAKSSPRLTGTWIRVEQHQ